uniref:NADH dehydrogenase [ubiquinone] 1 beta subcomplex subunit 5, mitochondrial n=1 Tax=Evadne anonyx TaxID=141404 RepID=A0A9N6WY99_9CRUS|nr:EOG090X0FIE [Evadne anonyx]
MAVLSVLRFASRNVIQNGVCVANGTSSLLTPSKVNALQLVRKMGDHRPMKIAPSRWSWNRFKDMLNFYFMLGIIPAGTLILSANLFVGPSTLAEAPEGYTPQHWEYYSHPITRFIAKHWTKSYQQEYEMMIQFLYEEEYKQKLRLAEKRIKKMIAEKRDFEAYYYEPVTARYQELVKNNVEQGVFDQGSSS